MGKKYYLSYNLQFFAKDDGGERTEDATPKKLREARRKGQVAKSHDLVMAISLLGLFLLLKLIVGRVGLSFLETYQAVYDMLSRVVRDPFTGNTAKELVQYGLVRVLFIAAPAYLVAFLIGFIGNLYQVKWVVSTEPLHLKFSKLNPVSGFKKLFSKDKIVELLKSIVKVGIIGFIVYDALRDQWGLLRSLYDFSLLSAIELIGNTVINLGIKISLFFLLIGAADYKYQKYKFKEDMKMTKQEVKDEYKQAEGDPKVKGQIRQKMLQVSRRRMMQSMPEADVVITNPTHLAVAIKYDKESQGAPIVIAKGADYLAEKIKEAARANEVEIVENKPLARMLYYNVELGMEIPPELYQTVAEVLAYVYRLKGKL